MLLLFLAILCVFFEGGLCYSTDQCFGSYYKIPFLFVSPFTDTPLYFRPRNGKPTRVLVNNGTAMEPRVRVKLPNIYIDDVTKEYEGEFRLTTQKNISYPIAKLRVSDCAEEVRCDYGFAYEHRLPVKVEIIEFTPADSLNKPKILWNRRKPNIKPDSRSQVTNNVWKFSDLTQKDNGYYNFREIESNRLVSRILLTVEEHHRYVSVKEGNVLFIEYPIPKDFWSDFTPDEEWEDETPLKHVWTATFTPEEDSEFVIKVIEDGQVSKNHWFRERFEVVSNGIEVAPAEPSDSGTFEFRDSQGNLVMIVHVEVEDGFRTDILLFFLVVVGLPIAIIVCCCCYCKKKCRPKNPSSPSQPQTSPTVYHDNSEPSGPPPAYSYPSVNVHVATQPPASVVSPPGYHELSTNTNPTQPEDASPGMPDIAPVPPLYLDCLSSGNDPQFEVKGIMFPSAPPLDSDSTVCDVYTSDNLNFL